MKNIVVYKKLDTSVIIWGDSGGNCGWYGGCGKGSDEERAPEWDFGGLGNGSENGKWGEFKGTAQTPLQSHAFWLCVQFDSVLDGDEFV